MYVHILNILFNTYVLEKETKMPFNAILLIVDCFDDLSTHRADIG